jgi:hypothetical protein
MIGTRRLTGTLAACVALGAVACNNLGPGYGDPNSIIAVMSPQLWDGVEGDVYAALEKTIFTVGEEKAYTVTYQEPYAEYWNQLRRFKQMLVVGTLSDQWVQEALDRGRAEASQAGVLQVHNVWALDQTITVVVVPEGSEAASLRQHLPEIHEMLDRQYLDYARNRMYQSGVDTALADTLATEAGFSLILPMVYRWRAVNDSTYVFRNDNPDPSELIREVVVTWMSPSAARLSADDLLAWRARLVSEFYAEPQDVRTDDMMTDTSPFLGHEAVRVQAQWLNPPSLGWPAGGPFITLGVTCPNQDRTYLIDAWLYAPGKEKYEYMIQLETILETFECE